MRFIKVPRILFQTCVKHKNNDSYELSGYLAGSYSLAVEMITKVQPLQPVTYFKAFSDIKRGKSCIEALRDNQELIEKIAKDAGVNKNQIIIPDPLTITSYKNIEDSVQV